MATCIISQRRRLGERDHSFAALDLADQQGDTRMGQLRARVERDTFWKTDARLRGTAEKDRPASAELAPDRGRAKLIR